MHRLNLHFYHVCVSIRTKSKKVFENLQRDFSWFRTPTRNPTIYLKILIDLEMVPAKRLALPYFFTQLSGRAYGFGDQRYVKYPGTLSYFDSRRLSGHIVGNDDMLLYHYAYYMIISKVGELLDLAGLSRFHALSVSFRKQAFLFTMGIGGGKSTLGFKLMEDSDFLLASEDTPLIDRQGYAYPFPIRLSFRPAKTLQIPQEFCRIRETPLFGTKMLVDIEFLGLHRIQQKAHPVQAIFWGIKTRQSQPTICKMPRLKFLGLLLVQVVLAKDCPQRAELFLRISPRGIAMILKILAHRLKTALSLWLRSRGYYFYMTPCISSNATAIKSFLSNRSG